MKSGATLKGTKPLEDTSYVDLRRAAKEMNISGLGSNPTRKQLIDAINKGSGASEVKGSSKVSKEKKEAIVKVVKAKIEETRLDLEERVIVLETLLGTMIEEFGEVMDTLRGKTNLKVKEGKQIVLTSPEISYPKVKPVISTKVKTKAELQAEFDSIKFS